MADDPKPGDQRPPPTRSTRSSTVASRSGKKRVDLSGSRGTTPGGAATGTTTAKKRSAPVKRPLWKRGGFWFAVIVFEAACALGISFLIAEPTLDDIPLDGGDVGQMCPLVVQFRDNPVQELSSDNAPEHFQYQADGYRRLVPVAPDAIRADLEHLAALTDELVATANEVKTRKATDPSFTGALTDFSRKEGEIGERGKVSGERVTNVINRACGIDLNVETTPVGTTPPENTGSVPSSSVPGSSGTTDPNTPGGGTGNGGTGDGVSPPSSEDHTG